MLDINFVREHREKVEGAIRNRNKKINVERLLELDEKRRAIITEMDALRAEQNEVSKKSKGGVDAETIAKMKNVKERLKTLEAERGSVEPEYAELLNALPNMPDADVPVGKDESENVVRKVVGKPTEFNFEPLDHVALGEKHDLFDIDRAVKVSGSRFTYVKNEAALLQMALVRYTWDILMKRGFTPVVPPVLAKIDSVVRAGHPEALSEDAYRTALDELVLVGSSEQSLVNMYMDETLDVSALPIRYTGYSTCFRREAGTYGKDTRGILRQHQFDKIEMVSFTTPESSAKELEFLTETQEKLLSGLELPYRVVDICTGDMGFSGAKQVDMEVWMPSQEKYRETHSASNCRDFQTRRLNTKYKNAEGKKEFAHALNATAFAIGRILIALLENHQEKDGNIRIPKALHKYCGFKKIGK